MATKTTLPANQMLKAIAERLRTQYGAERVLVYGSAARGAATEHSNIDLLVIARTKERFYARLGSVLAVARDLSYEELSDRLARGDKFVQEDR